MKYSIIVVALLGLFFSACNSESTNANGEAMEMSPEDMEKSREEMSARLEKEKTVFGNKKYILESFNVDNQEKTLNPELQIVVSFFGETVVVGNCSAFRGKFEIGDDTKISFSDLIKMRPRVEYACPMEQEELESSLFKVFTNISSYTLSEEGKIVLTDGSSEVKLLKAR